REACGPWADSAQEARTNKMAVKYPAFRKKFPLLVTGSLLALQPVISLQASAAEQFDCQVGPNGGWACAPKTASSNLPPRPQPSRSSLSAASESATGQAAAKPQTALVTESKGRALASRSADYSHLDWVPREKLTAAQLAEAGPYCA